MCFTNGKGATKEGALASALGEYIERLSNNHFYAGSFWGEDIANAAFVHYPDERWFKPGPKDALPAEILDEYCLQIYNPDGELRASNLLDTNSGTLQRGIFRSAERRVGKECVSPCRSRECQVLLTKN